MLVTCSNSPVGSGYCSPNNVLFGRKTAGEFRIELNPTKFEFNTSKCQKTISIEIKRTPVLCGIC